MSEYVRFETDEGATLLVEVEEDSYGIERVSRDRLGVINAGRHIEEALASVRPAIRSAVKFLADVAPDEHELEFGIKLTAQAGALVAKTAAEGHFVVRMRWQRESAGSAGALPDPAGATPEPAPAGD